MKLLFFNIKDKDCMFLFRIKHRNIVKKIQDIQNTCRNLNVQIQRKVHSQITHYQINGFQLRKHRSIVI